MKRAQVVIGAGFGDEGKGLFTDYMASRSAAPATVVRFNGGAQAGHTVTTPEGQRHVFSHFGAGSFAGARTFLSRFFAVNPLLFLRERSLLQALGVAPEVVLDAEAPVTTPYDMMINQMAEDARGSARHGSCGVGFGETIARHEDAEHRLVVRDLLSPLLADKLNRIRRHWLPRRLLQLGIPQLEEAWQRRVESADILESFITSCQRLCALASIAPSSYLATQDAVIFEGAQGLLLDQRFRFFPHVTRSNTGLQNVVALAREAGFAGLDVLYATRSYLTRHGAGPLPFELPEKPYERIVDLTNKPHPYQGSLRFAPLNLDLLHEAVTADLAHATGQLEVQVTLGVSCCDQLGEHALYTRGGELCTTSPAGLLNQLQRVLQPVTLLTSHGPTRSTVQVESMAAAPRRLYA